MRLFPNLSARLGVAILKLGHFINWKLEIKYLGFCKQAIGHIQQQPWNIFDKAATAATAHYIQYSMKRGLSFVNYSECLKK